MFKLVLGIRGEKDTVKISNDDGEGIVGRRCRQMWLQNVGHQAATKRLVIAGGQVKMDEGHVTNLEMLEVAWS